MTVAADIATDWQYVDGIETVTHTPQPGGTPDTSVKALRGELSWREVQLGGPAGLAPDDLAFDVWAATVTDVPKQGDTLTDGDATVYTILSVSAKTIGATAIRYRCLARGQVA